jgi:methyl-accepting chemotaxis protein
VVNKVKTASAMKVNFAHDAADTIPLPATMIHELSEALAKSDSGMTLKLYSAYPFPDRASRKLDSFDGGVGGVRAQSRRRLRQICGGQRHGIVRVAIADRMTMEACVNCHNTHADSPEKDWAATADMMWMIALHPSRRSPAAWHCSSG